MKKNLLYLFFLPLAFIVACGSDDEPDVNLLIGEWELDDITISSPPSGYGTQGINLTPSATINGESSYQIEFKDDFTYERLLRDARAVNSNGEPIIIDFEDDGEWEEDGTDLDLDQDNFTVSGIPTRFTVVEKAENSLTLETQDFWFAWSPALVSAGGADTITTSQGFDSLADAGWLEVVEMTFTMEFDRD